MSAIAATHSEPLTFERHQRAVVDERHQLVLDCATGDGLAGRIELRQLDRDVDAGRRSEVEAVGAGQVHQLIADLARVHSHGVHRASSAAVKHEGQ